ncbi:MAG TPA: tetratricopeptide repeat protein [Leptolyngbyaceae cyanobacterium]
MTHSRLGDYPKALNYYQQSLAIHQAISDRSGEGGSLNNIGFIYDSLGDYFKALDYYQRSLAISQAISDRSGEGTTLNNIGFI